MQQQLTRRERRVVTDMRDLEALSYAQIAVRLSDDWTTVNKWTVRRFLEDERYELSEQNLIRFRRAIARLEGGARPRRRAS